MADLEEAVGLTCLKYMECLAELTRYIYSRVPKLGYAYLGGGGFAYLGLCYVNFYIFDILWCMKIPFVMLYQNHNRLSTGRCCTKDSNTGN